MRHVQVMLYVLLLVVTGCASVSHVLIHKGEDARLIKGTKNAVIFWNQFFDGDVFTLVITDEQRRARTPAGKVRVHGTGPIKGDGTAYVGVEKTYRMRNVIEIQIHDAKGNDTLMQYDPWLTMAHELGHVLGLDHEDTNGNVMHSYINLAGAVVTMEQLETIYRKLKRRRRNGISIAPKVVIPRR